MNTAIRILRYLEKQDQSRLLAAAVILLLLTGTADYFTGYRLGFSLFYLAPIFLVTSSAGLRAGIITSAASTAVWLASDYFARLSYAHPLIPLWNALIRFGFFITLTYMLSSLKDSLENEKRASRYDYLTGLPNLRSFYETARLETDRMKRTGKPMSAAYIDLDNFKSVNDSLGHLSGNSLLKAAAETLKSGVRSIDTPARLGGDEFIILMPETDAKGAAVLMERLNAGLLRKMGDNGWPVTFSIGVSTFTSAPESVDELVRKADNLMYSAKKNGKNTIKYNAAK